jgi:hypothetical protein
MSTKYKYSEIKDIVNQDNYNFYGIVYDATYPTMDDSPNTYVCNVKIIDTDTNCLTFPNSLSNELVTLIIKSNTKDNLPTIHNIGDILRIHRGHYVSILTYSNIKIISSFLIFRNLRRKRLSTFNLMVVRRQVLAGACSQDGQVHLMTIPL